MGSDHRAVKVRFDIGERMYWEKTLTPKVKGWRPCLNEEGIPKRFQMAVSELSLDKDTCKPEVLETILYHAAITPNVSEAYRYRSKPWDAPEVQALLRQRRGAVSSEERKHIAKVIKKIFRKLIRKHNDTKVENI